MRAWSLILGGLIIWTTHFFAVYAIASLFPGQVVARWLTIGATLLAMTAAGWLLLHSLAEHRHAARDYLERWIAGLSALGSGTALIAVFYQGLPAFFA